MYYNQDLLEKYDVTSWLDDNIVTFDEMMSLAGKMDEGDYVVNNALLSWVILAQIRNLEELFLMRLAIRPLILRK